MQKQPDTTSKPKPARRWLIWTCLLGALIVVIAALFLALSTYLRAQLAAMKAEIRAKGEPLTSAELPIDQPGDPAANADLADVVREIKELQTVLLKPGIRLASGLEFDASNRPLMRPAFLESAPHAKNSDNTLTWEGISTELRDPIAPLLVKLTDALHRGAYPPRSELSKGLAASHSGVTDLQKAIVLLAARAEFALRSVDIDAALDDLQTVLVLVRRELPGEPLIPILVGNLSRAHAWRMTWSILQHQGLTTEQLQRLLGLLDPPVRPGDLAGALATERAMCIDQFEQARQNHLSFGPLHTLDGGAVSGNSIENFFLSGLWFIWSPLLSYSDEIAYLSIMTPQIDALRAPNSRARLDALGTLPTVASQLPNPPWVAPLTHVLVAAIGSIPPRVEATAAMFALAKAAAVIRLFELTHGKLPDSLAAAAASAKTALPDDPLGSGSLIYRPLASGGFLLYSVGANGVDDGGDGRVTPPSRRNDVESGADLVWPGLLDAWPENGTPAK